MSFTDSQFVIRYNIICTSTKICITAIRCVLNLPDNSAFRITKLKIDSVAIEDFVLIDGEKPQFQFETQFEKQDDMSRNFQWLSNIEIKKQYDSTYNGTTLIISSSVDCSLELDYRLLDIPKESGKPSAIRNVQEIKKISELNSISYPMIILGEYRHYIFNLENTNGKHT